MIEADLSSQLPGSRRDVDRLGGGVRGLVHRPDKRIRIIHAVAGLCTLVVGDADSVSRTLNLRQRLLKLNEVDAVGVLVVLHLDDLNMVTLVDLAVEQGVNLVETEACTRGGGGLTGFVVHVITADVLPGCLGGQVEGRSSAAGRGTRHTRFTQPPQQLPTRPPPARQSPRRCPDAARTPSSILRRPTRPWPP